MNLDKFTASLFETVTKHSGRKICAEVLAVPSEDFFPDGLPPDEDQAQLLLAAQSIGAFLAAGQGDIAAVQLSKTIDAFHSSSGTSYCPPLIAALDGL